MEDARERKLTPHEKAVKWAEQHKNLEKLKVEMVRLQSEIEAAENKLEHMKKSVQELVSPKRPRRIFVINGDVVSVERYKRAKPKYKAGTEPPPDKYGVRVELIEVESS